ncbi:MAG: S8 family serine peptidase [Candidatus Eisenbacteria bacterium]|uniref:S8 family serine peptidase n=1 Tax=Eiseniibacteriota bacterium TaxID=2212470 RepID=A0A849SFK9_UNCEI|nr:S8 family serine peptidase [Candidatus Eisenbacteria bacterium]
MVRSPSRRCALTLFIALFLALPGVSARAAEPPPARAFAPVQLGYQPNAPTVAAHVPGRVLVKLTAEARQAATLPSILRFGQPLAGATTGLAAVDRVFSDAGARSLQGAFIEYRNRTEGARLGLDRWLILDFAGSMPASELADWLSRLREVEAVTFDYIAFPAVVPADPMHSLHWGHNNSAQMLSYNWTNFNHETGSPVGTVGFDANAHTAWDGTQGFGSSSVRIAIIDSGVEAGHPDLLQVTGFDFGNNDSNPDDDSSAPGHGTACAGVAAARNNALGTAGIAAGCSIMPLKVANSAGTMTFVSIQNALTYAADNGANVISMSLGAAITSDPATDAAITYAWNAGCVILAATGNENKSTISYPAIHSLVIGVGAASPCGDRKRSSSSTSELNPGVSADPNGFTCDGERWWGSSYGTTTQGAAGAVDVIAPTILPTTDLLGAAGYDASDYSKWFNGTSCATPYAAGVCALIKSKNPTWTNAQIRDQLRNTAQDVTSVESGAGWDRYAGYGMVDAAAAVGGGGGPVDQVTVTAPNGGETLASGSSTNLTWTSVGSFTTVNLDYSTNGGSSWTSIVTGTPNDGSQAWTVPAAATTQGRVRVSGGTATDLSNANFTITVPSGGYATLPYTTGFENAGAFDAFWSTAVTANGRVRLLTTNTPHAGSYHMVMDDATSGSYSQTEARLRLNLAGQTQVNLSFWWKDFGDETQTQDGIYFSNDGGTSYVKVYSLTPASFSDNTWRNVVLDLDALAATAGLSLNSTFVVKFQQYDDYPISTDGMAFDDISVTVPSGGGGAITAESESNNTSATADGPVGTGVAVTGTISSAADQDYFFFDVSTAGSINVSLAIGSSADLDWFLYNSSLVEVARGYSTANPEVGNYTAAAGHYYLMVDGYQSATSNYTLTLNGGLANIIQPMQKDFAARPAITELLQNFPNPFRGKTAIHFALAQAGRVDLEVFDATGRLVATVAHGDFEPGVHKFQWDGRTDKGDPAARGMYFYRLTAPGFRETRKMLVLE